MSQIANEFKGASAYDILAWHRPVASGIVLGSILVVWFTFVFFEYTLATFLARAVQLLFVLGGASTFTKKVFVSAADCTASLDRAYEKLRPCAQRCVQRSFDILTWREVNASAKFFAASFAVAFVGNYVSDTTLFLLIVLDAFSLPIIYEKKKPEIDAQLSKLQRATDKYLGMLKTQGKAAKTKVEEARQEAEAEYTSRKKD